MSKESIDRLSKKAIIRRQKKRAFLSTHFPLSRQKRRIYLGIALFASSLLLVFSFLSRTDVDSSTKPTSPALIEGESKGALVLSPPPPSLIQSVEPPPSPIQRIEGFVNRGDSLSSLLGKYHVSANEIFELVLACKDLYNLDRMRQGNRYSIVINREKGELIRFEYTIDEERNLIAEQKDSGFESYIEKILYDIKTRQGKGKIESSLFETADEVGLSPQITLSMVDIFSWDIDFNADLRAGDTFSVIYEEKYLANDFARYGRILAALMAVQGEAHFAFFYKDKKGHLDYYDIKGNSLRKVFLKSPLRYTRISSNFSRKRFHPILKIYKPHLGIDYAAPTGTPVQAIGDGKVLYVGRKKRYGKSVKIKHNNNYQSAYGHLSRYAKGIKKNQTVIQGQIIGYVGATGLATGPHLDFRLLYKGRFINPLKINFPAARPVLTEELPKFKEKINEMLSTLNGSERNIISNPPLPNNQDQDLNRLFKF